jgi:hypothetical protein
MSRRHSSSRHFLHGENIQSKRKPHGRELRSCLGLCNHIISVVWNCIYNFHSCISFKAIVKSWNQLNSERFRWWRTVSKVPVSRMKLCMGTVKYMSNLQLCPFQCKLSLYLKHKYFCISNFSIQNMVHLFVKYMWNYTFTPPYFFMTWYRINHRKNFTLLILHKKEKLQQVHSVVHSQIPKRMSSHIVVCIEASQNVMTHGFSLWHEEQSMRNVLSEENHLLGCATCGLVDHYQCFRESGVPWGCSKVFKIIYRPTWYYIPDASNLHLCFTIHHNIIGSWYLIRQQKFSHPPAYYIGHPLSTSYVI